MVKKIKSFKFIPLVILAGVFLFRDNMQDFGHYLIWTLAFAVLGIIFLPIADLIFARFRCRGYMFARVLGLAMAGWLSWLLSSVHILPFRTWACYLVVAVFLVVNILINRKTKTYQSYISDNDLFKSSVNKETLFMAMLLCWTYLRALRPEIEGLEKYMEFGFINSILRNDWMPAPDMWLAGESINYYYLGHYLSAFMTRLTDIHPAISYNLMMASLFAISFMLAYSIGSFLVQYFLETAETVSAKVSAKKQRIAEIAGGALAGAVITLAGNLHSMIFGILFPQWNDHDFYWFPSATRYIGFNPVVEGDGTIHEFPLYSYIVADLHAHVINMIFVLTAVAVIIALAVHLLGVLNKSPRTVDIASSVTVRSLFTKEGIGTWFHPGFIVLMLLIGLFTGMNTWDFPIYIVVTGGILLYVNLKLYDFSNKSIWMTVAQMGAIAAGAYILTLPFHLTFESMGTAVSFTSHRSMIRQLLVLWGFQLFFGVALTIVMWARYRRQGNSAKGAKGKNTQKKAKAKTAGSEQQNTEGAQQNALFRYIDAANPADGIAFILFICATGLFIIPEIIYVVDIYGSQPRANTMFKLGYQAFILFGLGVGYTMVRLFFEDAKKFRAKYAFIAVGIILLGSAFVYPFYAIPGWYGGDREMQGLDGTTYMITENRDYKTEAENTVKVNMSDDHALVQYINENIPGSPVLLEAIATGNDSYTINGRISANTGLPNILNWYWHEYLWRHTNNAEKRAERTAMLDMRRDDINSFYSTSDAAVVQTIIDKYDVRYIVVGEIERLRYPEIDEALLMSMGEVVFRSGELYMIEVNKEELFDSYPQLVALREHVFGDPRIISSIENSLHGKNIREDFNAVFISICDIDTRAVVFTGTGNSVEAAWNRAERAAAEYIKENDYNLMWAKADIVDTMEREPVTNLNEYIVSTVYSNFYRKGISLDDNFNTAFLEAEISGNKLMRYYTETEVYSGDIDYSANLLNQGNISFYLKTYRGEPEPGEMPSEIITFTTVGFFADEENRIFELHNEGMYTGRRREPVDDKYLERVVISASEYLYNMIQPDGEFIYGYWPVFDNEMESYNILRHASSLWSLVNLYRMTGNEQLVGGINAGLDYLIDSISYKDAETAFVIEHKVNEVKLGGNGLAIIAFTEYMDMFETDKYMEIVRHLANGILEMQEPDGSWYHVWNYPGFTEKEAYRTVYYDGEATFALVRAYTFTGDERFIEAGERAVEYFIANNYTKHRDHWIAYSMHEITKYRSDPRYFLFALQNVSNNIDRIHNQTTSFHTYLELLAISWQTYERLIQSGVSSPELDEFLENFDVGYFAQTLYHRADYMLNSFFFPEYAMYMKIPKNVLGTFFVRHDSFRIRIDDIQHFIGGYYYLLRNWESVSGHLD